MNIHMYSSTCVQTCTAYGDSECESYHQTAVDGYGMALVSRID